MDATFIADFFAPYGQLPHFWEHTIGSGHAALALRADWQQQLHRTHRELGFEHTRFHAILSNDMGTLVDENNQLIYSFFNADQLLDFLVSTGMAPFVELSFMPLALSSGDQTVFDYKSNITPPKDYAAWKDLIYTIVAHWLDRYGIKKMRNWFFEIWNEPNLPSFWTGTREGYFMLYKNAAEAIKTVHPDLQVGGPATASNAWITEFRDFCEKNKTPYDFISTHHYPTDAFGKPGDDTVTQLADSRRSILNEQVTETRKRAGNTPVFYTEWSTSSNPFDTLHDQPYAAAFITKTIMEARGMVQGYSYWTFSDIFDENYFSSIPFHGGFGLMTIHGIPKPAYRAFELLHRLGNELLTVSGTHPTIDVWVIKGPNALHVLLTNSALPRHHVETGIVSVVLNKTINIERAYIERIDDTHANATAAWEAMGKPGTLSPIQVSNLEINSSLIKEPLSVATDKGAQRLDIEIPPQGTALITLETK
jgi:xylan 1,4-beta-xylosidase